MTLAQVSLFFVLAGVPTWMSFADGGRKIRFYRNPMDPSIHSNVPMKDSMGMDYVPVYEDTKPDSSGPRVEGRAPFHPTAEQLKLSGARLVLAERRDLAQELRVPGRSLGGGRVSFQVFEQDLPLVVAGQSFHAFSPSTAGETLIGKITSIETILDPMTRTARVNGLLSTKAGVGLRTEASLSGVIEAKHPAVLTVPEEAVLHAGSRDLVFVSGDKGEILPREVFSGARAGGLIEIKKGLRDGETVSSGPNFLLDAESRIQATYDSP